MRDGDKMAAWLREAADELDKAHAVLDDAGIPRSLPGVTDGTESERTWLVTFQPCPNRPDLGFRDMVLEASDADLPALLRCIEGSGCGVLSVEEEEPFPMIPEPPRRSTDD